MASFIFNSFARDLVLGNIALGSVTVWVSGGTAGADAVIQLAFETAGGRSFERSWTLPIRTL